MKKITPRSLSELSAGDRIDVHFTRIQGRRGGESVIHETTIETVDTSKGLTYEYDGDMYSFEMSTGYVRDGESITGSSVIGRDGRVEIENNS